MKTTLIILMLISAIAQAQDSWHFKSSQDDFTVTSGDNQLTIGSTVIENKKAFDEFLKILLKANRGDCPTLGEAQLTVEAKNPTVTVTKKFYPVEGAIESNGKCSNLEYDTGWSLPFHREWFSAGPAGKITIGNSMTFKSPDLSFTVNRKENDWASGGKGFVPDVLRMADFARAADNFKIDKRYNKKVKENSRSNFTLTTGGAAYKFYHINGLWAVEFPKSPSLAATKDFAMLGRFAKNELGDNRSDEMGVLGNKTAPPEERLDLLDKMSNVDSPAFKNTLHRILKDPEENMKLKEQVALLLVDRPSSDNVKALMTLLEKGTMADKAIASKVLKRLNPSGPQINDDDGAEADEKLRKWRDWYVKYSKATK
jgi:hypothetical protein